MKCVYNLYSQTADPATWFAAEEKAATHKRSRPDVIRFRRNKRQNLEELRRSFLSQSFEVHDYRIETIFDKKARLLAKLPYIDHIYQWGLLYPAEKALDVPNVETSYACRYGKGIHVMARDIMRMIQEDQAGDTDYYGSFDIKSFYATMPHAICKKVVARKIGDRIILDELFKFIDKAAGTEIGNPCNENEAAGFPLGIKFSPAVGNLLVAYMTHDLYKWFGILENPTLKNYYLQRYIEHKIFSARTPADAAELEKGIAYLSERFDENFRRPKKVFTYSDNIYIFHRDKAFLHLITEWIGLYLSTEYHLSLNPKWHIAPTYTGVPSPGYIVFGSHIRPKGPIKHDLCRNIAKGKKLGLSQKTMRKANSGLLGHCKHANCKNLIRKIGMEKETMTVGQVLEAARTRFDNCKAIPLERLVHDPFAPRFLDNAQAREEDERSKRIRIVGHFFMHSKYDKNEDGTPKTCLVFCWTSEAAANKEQRYVSWTGSEILIDRIERDPWAKMLTEYPTVIKYEKSVRGKKYLVFG